MDTKKVNQGAVASIAGTDLVMVAGPSGCFHPISFANFMASIEIGGRNYIPNSNFYSGLPNVNIQGGTSVLVVDSYESNPIRFGKNAMRISSNNADTYCVIPIGSLESGRTYTLTIWGRNAGNIIGSSSYIMVDGVAVIYIDTRFQTQNSYSVRSLSFFIPKNDNAKNIEYRDIQLRLGIVTAGQAWMLIEAMKLERGNVATDWSPAPEDIASGLWGGGNYKILKYLQFHRRRVGERRAG